MARAYQKRPRERTVTIRRGVQLAFPVLNIWIGVQFYLWVRYFEKSGFRWRRLAARRRFVAGVGTGGTIMGTGRYLKTCDSRIRVHPLEPVESPTLSTGRKIGQHRIQGISDEFVPSILKRDELDSIIAIHDGDAIIMAQQLAGMVWRWEISSGANFIGALKAQTILGGNAATVTFCDSNKEYLSPDLFAASPVRAEYEAPHVEIRGYSVLARSCAFCAH